MHSENLPDPVRILFEALNHHRVRFLMVGMSSAVLQGAPAATEDIDIWVEHLGSPAFLEAVKSAGAFYIAPGPVGQTTPMLGPEPFRLIDIVPACQGLEAFDVEWARAICLELDGIPVRILSLERIVLSKRTTNRAKDRAMLPLLENTLKVIQSREKSDCPP